MEIVILRIFKVNQSDRRHRSQALIESSAEVIIIQFLADVTQHLKILSFVTWIQFSKLLLKHFQQDIGIVVIDSTLGGFVNLPEVFISQASQMHHCWHLYPCCFIEFRHICFFLLSFSDCMGAKLLKIIQIESFSVLKKVKEAHFVSLYHHNITIDFLQLTYVASSSAPNSVVLRCFSNKIADLHRLWCGGSPTLV